MVPNPFLSIFITVGTTEFDKLISCIDSEEFLIFLTSRKCSKLNVQIGRGLRSPDFLRDNCPKHNIAFSCFRLKDTLSYDMDEATLIISHAGSYS